MLTEGFCYSIVYYCNQCEDANAKFWTARISQKSFRNFTIVVYAKNNDCFPFFFIITKIYFYTTKRSIYDNTWVFNFTSVRTSMNKSMILESAERVSIKNDIIFCI
jgi:hypothetical protein